MVTVPGPEVQRALRCFFFITTLNGHRSKDLSKLCFELGKHHSLKLFSPCVCLCARVCLFGRRKGKLLDISSVIMQFAVLDFPNRAISFC